MFDYARATSAPDLIDCTTDSKITRPSAPPSIDSHARSGCGIIPTTFRASLQMPAMAAADPFGIPPSSADAHRPRFGVAEDHLAVALEPREHLGLGEVVAFAVRDRQSAAPGPSRHCRRERRVGLLDAQMHVLAAELQTRGSATSRRAAARLRAEPESRCRCRARGRRVRRTPRTSRMIGEKRAIAPVRR